VPTQRTKWHSGAFCRDKQDCRKIAKKPPRFVNYAVEQIAENRLDQEVGTIAKKALGTELKFDVTTTDAKSTETDSKQTVDVTYEVMQMLIAADRLLSMHPDSVGLVSISKGLKSPEDNVFPLGKDGKFAPFTLREALGSQYAANLARAVYSQEASFSLAEWKALNRARVGMAYLTAKEGIEILDGLTTDNEQVKQGIQKAKTHLELIVEAAKTINPDVETDFLLQTRHSAPKPKDVSLPSSSSIMQPSGTKSRHKHLAITSRS
jgi:hypothetical protein